MMSQIQQPEVHGPSRPAQRSGCCAIRPMLGLSEITPRERASPVMICARGLDDREPRSGAGGVGGAGVSDREKGGSLLMSFTPRQRVVLQTTRARDKAEVLLEGLINAQRAVDSVEPMPRRAEIIARASMDRAIRSTKQLVATLNQAIEEAERDLCDIELAILDEADCTCAVGTKLAG